MKLSIHESVLAAAGSVPVGFGRYGGANGIIYKLLQKIFDIKIMSISAGDEYTDEGSIKYCCGRRKPRCPHQTVGDRGG